MRAGSTTWTNPPRVLPARYVCYYLIMLSNAIQVVAVYIAGEAVGALTQTAVADQMGRIKFMQMMCVVVTIGTTIQTASVNLGMFLAGRALAGFAVG